jgi:nitroreductase
MVVNTEFEGVTKTRASIRNYSAKIVEDEKINYVIECARLAPS